MKKAGGGIFLAVGLLLISVGASSYLYQKESAKFNGKIISGDWRGVLDYTADLRAKPWFWALKAVPSLDSDLLMKEGWSLYKIGDRELAEKKFREAAELPGNQKRAKARFNAATINLSLETVERAIADYEKTLSEDPNYFAAQKNLEILQMIKAEGQEDSKKGDKDSGDDDKNKEKNKKRSRTKDKLEYRDSDSDGDSQSPSQFRY